MTNSVKTCLSVFPRLPCSAGSAIKTGLPSLSPISHLAANTGKIASTFLHELGSLLQGLAIRRWCTSVYPTIKTGLSGLPCPPPVSHLASETGRIFTTLFHELGSLLTPFEDGVRR